MTIEELLKQIAEKAPNEWETKQYDGDEETLYMTNAPWKLGQSIQLSGCHLDDTVDLLEWLNKNDPDFYLESCRDGWAVRALIEGTELMGTREYQVCGTIAEAALYGLLFYTKTLEGESE